MQLFPRNSVEQPSSLPFRIDCHIHHVHLTLSRGLAISIDASFSMTLKSITTKKWHEEIQIHSSFALWAR